jgi:hypothetical protein
MISLLGSVSVPQCLFPVELFVLLTATGSSSKLGVKFSFSLAHTVHSGSSLIVKV